MARRLAAAQWSAALRLKSRESPERATDKIAVPLPSRILEVRLSGRTADTGPRWPRETRVAAVARGRTSSHPEQRS